MNMFKIRISQFWVLLKYYIVVLYVIAFRRKTINTWLISERGDEARDNGFVFFKYLKNNHPEIKCKYIINKKSVDIEKVKPYINDVIYYRSIKHIYYFILSKYLISSHIMGYSPDFRSMGKLDRKKLLYYRGYKIFLQHGIVKDNTPGLYYDNTKLDLFICGANNEYNYVNSNFHYPKNIVKYTGLARFDDLDNSFDNTILLMPTWRENLYKLTDDEFKKTNYFIRYNSLINNQLLNSFLKEKGFKLIFYPHYEIQKRINCFNTTMSNIIIADSKNYSVPVLLKKNSLLITDYSSVYFDQAFLKKPVIYYQFDYEEYRAFHYKEGWFSYQNNGFGSIVKNEDELLKVLFRCFDNNFELESKYLTRINDTFKFNDKNNCERIFNEIIKIDYKRKKKV